MTTQSVKNVMREEHKKLLAQREELDKKISGLEAAISAYSSKGSSSGGHKDAGDSDFTNLVKSVFEANQNKPLQVKDIIEEIVRKDPSLDKQKAGNKMFTVIRNKKLVKVSYGKYIYRGITTTNSAEVKA
jgi:hypothetical protein